MARLFVALWPDAAVRARLAAHRDAWRWPPGARLVDAANLHVTLHYIGGFARADIAALCDRLAPVRAPRFDVHAASTAVWRGGIAVLGLASDAALAALHAEIGGVLRGFGVALDERPYAPHVTLARRAARAEAPPGLPALDWQADGFVLVESCPGPPADYRVLARWGESAAARTG